jgi:hypothetical protein
VESKTSVGGGGGGTPRKGNRQSRTKHNISCALTVLNLNCNKSNDRHNNNGCLFLLDPRKSPQLQGFSQASYRCSGLLTGSTAGTMDYLWSEIGRTIRVAELPKDHCTSKQYTVPTLRGGSVLFLLATQGADAKLIYAIIPLRRTYEQKIQ